MTAGRPVPWMIWIPGAVRREDDGTDVMAAAVTEEATGAREAAGEAGAAARTMEWQGFSSM